MIVNLYHPEFWIRHGHWGYDNQTPGNSSKWGNFEYRINRKGISESDYVVVHDDIDQSLTQKVKVGGLVLVIGEEKAIKNYNQEFLNQFDLIISSRDDIHHPHVIRSHYLHPWWVKKTYDELISMKSVKKSFRLSSIISNLTSSPSHKERYTFINKLKGHYKNELEWFSRGENTFLEDKWDGLAPYEYSIAVENSSYDNYFTEKITDCFLAFTMPFYSGCHNLKDFFDDRSFVTVYPSDFIKSIDVIDQSIQSDLSTKNQKFIHDSRKLVLEKYHFIAALSEILSRLEKSSVKIRRTIHPQYFFNNGMLKRLVKGSIHRIINGI